MATLPTELRPDVNTASRDELARVRGIGERRAIALVNHRATHGPFRSLHELANVEGFSKELAEHLADRLRIVHADARARGENPRDVPETFEREQDARG